MFRVDGWRGARPFCPPKTRQRPILCRLSRAGVAEAARFGQLSVLAQRRVLATMELPDDPIQDGSQDPDGVPQQQQGEDIDNSDDEAPAAPASAPPVPPPPQPLEPPLKKARTSDASPLVMVAAYRAGGDAVLQGDVYIPPAVLKKGRGKARVGGGALSVTEKNAPGVFSQRVDASRALCPYDLRGLCHDPKCPWQSRDDYVLTREERIAAHDVFSRSNGRVRSGGDVFSVRSVITPHEKYPECLALRSINFDAKPLRRHATTRRRKWLLSSQGKDPPEVKTPLYNSPSVARLEGRGIGCVVRSVVARVGEEPPELATRGYRYFN